MRDKLFNHFLDRLRSVNNQPDWAAIWYKEMNMDKHKRFTKAFLTSKYRPEIVRLACKIADQAYRSPSSSSFTFNV